MSDEKKKKEKKYDEKKGWIIAEGEVTGHSHSIKGKNDVKVYEEAGKVVNMLISKSTPLTHEEHLPNVLPKGSPKVRIIKEYDPISQKIYEIKD